MEYRYHPPAASLEGYVRSILNMEDFTQGDSLPILPQGTASLVCLVEKQNPDKNKSTTLLLFTRSIDGAVLQGYTGFSLVAYFFHPFMVGPLFGIQAKKLADYPEQLHTWNVKKTELLLKKLNQVQTNHDRIRMLDDFLQEQFIKNRAACEIVRFATDRLVEDPSSDILPQLLGDLQISDRTLQRLFKKYVGLSPAHFRRFCQFHAAFHQLRKREFGNLSDVAYDQGYADQSHFIRSFREFTRKNPGDYMRSGLDAGSK